MKIIEVNHGLANNFGDYIEINKNLRKYPHLLSKILKHELSHTDKVFSFYDLKIDFLSDSNVNSFDLLKFMFKHPKSFTQLLPIYWTRKKGFVVDINLSLVYLIMFTIFMIVINIGTIYL